MGSMSVSHWLIVLIVVVLFFGPKKLPNIGKSLGEGIRALREGLSPQEEAKRAEKEASEKESKKESKKDEEDA